MKKKAARDDVGFYVNDLLDSSAIGPQIVFHNLFPGAEAEYGANMLEWSSGIRALLRDKGINLYSHQALATDHVRAGRSIVVATPTASGKTLIYNLPVLETYLRNRDTRALYLFPLKALAQDQLLAFRKLTSAWPQDARPAAELYDGDTPDSIRKKIRKDPPAVLLTNPEMLHLSLLPYHTSWATFLANLDYVIVDEAHIYRGMFGSHMSQVFRRLNRITAHYGSSPTYVLCTATLGNPEELGQKLLGETPVLINKSGAPQGARHFIFINPETSAATCAIDLLKRALERNLRTIVYCKTRRLTELVSIWAGSESGPFQNRISSYRAGFLPEERRDIEARMVSGELLAVVSTSALELGIDIGGLDVCILVGYPGTVMQTLQRGGRVGRSQRESAVIIVAGEDALDQYFMRNPQDFFERSPEKAVVNPGNEVICSRHLECAAQELPLKEDEPWLGVEGVGKAFATLRQTGLIVQAGESGQWVAARKYPQKGIDLRGSGHSYHIEDENGRIIGMMDAYRVWLETHPGAVYLHHGKNYVIDEVDDGRMRILARRQPTDWYTRIRSHKTTDILEVLERKSLGRCAVFRGKLRITDTITGYEKRSVSGNRMISITPLSVPPRIFETEGLWFIVPNAIRLKLEELFLHFMGSIHALEHAVIGLLPLEVMADRNDFGGISTPLHPQLGLPAVFVYDSLPGGAGLTSAAFAEARHILEAVQTLIKNCDCEDGCPSCIQSPKCGAGNRPLSKAGSLELLNQLLAPGTEGDEICAKLKISQAGTLQVCGEISGAVSLTKTPVHKPRTPPEHYVVFDVETRRSAAEVGGWHHADKMGVSVAVLYDSMDDAFHVYGEEELHEMFDRMKKADVVVGFNNLRFDNKVLEPFANDFNLKDLPSLDLLQKIYERLNYRVSLDNLGSATLNAPKTANGLQALKWWQEGKIEEIAEYCKMDVAITRDLYLYGLREGCLYYSSRTQDKIRVDVDFGFEKIKRPPEEI